MNADIIHIFQRTLTVLTALPFAFQLWSFFLCSRYKNDAMNIHATNREVFRSIKLRYTNSAKLNIPLSDTDSFISKYFYGRGGPFRFIVGLERVSALFSCVSLLGTTALYIRGYSDATRMIAIIAATLCYYIFRSALSTNRQMELTLSFTKDYLDNTLKHRVSPEPMRHNKGEAASASVAREEKVIDMTKPSLPQSHTDKSKDVSSDNTEQPSDIIEAVLKEFLA